MAVAYQASVSASAQFGSSITSPSVDGTGTDRYLYCSGALFAFSGPQTTACTWDVASPQNLTNLAESTDTGFTYNLSVYGLVNQTSATDTCTMTWDESQNIAICVVTFTGVDQTTPEGNEQQDFTYVYSGSGDDEQTLTCTNVENDDFVISSLCYRSETTYTIGANQTSRCNEQPSGYGLIFRVETQDGADGGAMSHTRNGSAQDMRYHAIVIKAPATGGAGLIDGGLIARLPLRSLVK